MSTVPSTPGDDQTPRPVTRPSDVPEGESISALIERWTALLLALVDVEHGLGEPQPGAAVHAMLLEHLAIGDAVASRLLGLRWSTARQALRHGVSLDDVAAAMGLAVHEVEVALARPPA
ncbi:hypothetical protein PSU4_17250 [Pseudonocardia sulfidoxydans NBRC 16205]|uniref:ANTAR domain-containing protein n=1 Tax=Pseudonocardia sulfidoxydans NBRC 16205 TaxID=1223511 RepID=A0A511DD90_9PSEU|nr:hypothetical protein [Pseudonocardia sulfidoxydans]GEL22771.1 hypothetical protein PSU4_17250 [Pseudonocardia sulfidoxydans NBRC 16205]